MKNRSLSYLICVDGSPSSIDFFNNFLHEHIVMGDRVCALHIYNSSNPNFLISPEDLRFQLECQLLMKLPGNDFAFKFEQKVEKFTSIQIVKSIPVVNPNLLILSFNGPKGPKKKPGEIGSSIQYSLYRSPISVLYMKILEFRSRLPYRGYTWMVCVDNSNRALSAFHLAVRLHNTNFDRIGVIHIIKNTEESKQVEEKYKKAIYESGVNGQFFQLECRPEGKGVHSILIRHLCARDVNVHFVLCGIDGDRAEAEGKTGIGTVPVQLVMRAPCNTLIVK
ncbi:unnamed protein product [Blepharisma stoltei]|uniref:UspA domain-containing protein n=1 Tax=Blepharisma stoltei TaxID=1481888 RepID=A0AAU9KKE5_9CILI|nr:unnamed protein product [Blepharisma stoltei]